MTLPMVAFKMFAPRLVASRDAAGQMRIEGIASSTVRDHHGDEITLKALKKMADSSVGMTIFMNHEYRLPEDVFGAVEKSRIVKSGDKDKTGNPIYDLRLGIIVAGSNPDAVRTFELIEKDQVKLGLSIGAMLPEGGYTLNKTDGGRLIIDDIDLVETSMVSIPANPRAFVDYAVKAITGVLPDTKPKSLAARKSWFDKVAADNGAVPPEAVNPDQGDESDDDGDDGPSDEPAETIEKTIDANAIVDEFLDHRVEAGDLTESEPPETAEDHAQLGEALELAADHPDIEKGKTDHQHPHAHVHGHEHDHGYGESLSTHKHDHAHSHSHGHGPDHDHADTMDDYSHNHPHNGSYDNEDHAHGDGAVKAEPEPEITKAHKITVWEDPDGGRVTEVHVGRSKPKAEDGDHSVQDSLEPETTGGLTGDGTEGETTSIQLSDAATNAELLKLVKEASGNSERIVKALLGQLMASRADLIASKEREQILLRLLKGMSDGTQSILERVGRLPAGRKTVEFPQIKEDFDGLSDIYAADVRKLMTKGRR